MTVAFTTERSQELHERAKRFLPLGVTGDGRYEAPYPIVFTEAHGKRMVDVDGNAYLDLHGGFGTAILGYSHPEVDDAVVHALRKVGAFVGVPHVYEEQLAERLCALIPEADRVALCGGGGSDAIYHAVRLARAATGRRQIVKVEGGYHGWHGDVGVSTRPELDDPAYVGRPAGVPNSPGILPEIAAAVTVVSTNDGEALASVFAETDDIAAVLVEPALYSSGCVVVDPAYLRTARELCTKHGAVLIFDEIMSGFRAGLPGAGSRAGVVPDLGAYGKALANGHMLAVLAGRESLMTQLAPQGPVFYSGTFNGHPIACAAAEATLDVIERDGVIDHVDAVAARIAAGINQQVAEAGLRAVCQSYGGVWTLYFGTGAVRNYRDLAQSVTPAIEGLNDEFRRFLRTRGLYMHKRHVNRCFVSALHDDADVDRIVEAVGEFLAEHVGELAR